MLLCEKVIHGDRAYMPFPEFHKIVKGVKVQVPQREFPYKCQRRAHRYVVRGQSFSCEAVLCEQHKLDAIREGFTLEEVI